MSMIDIHAPLGESIGKHSEEDDMATRLTTWRPHHIANCKIEVAAVISGWSMDEGNAGCVGRIWQGLVVAWEPGRFVTVTNLQREGKENLRLKRQMEEEKAKKSSRPVELAKEEEIDRPVQVYADGVYDLFHFGHARSLEQAKKLYLNDYHSQNLTFLIQLFVSKYAFAVGCCNDEVTPKYKGKTVMTDEERYESLSHCRIAEKWFMNGLESVEVAKAQDMSAIIIKGGKKLPANVYLALELVPHESSSESNFWDCRIAEKWFMKGLESIEVAKVQDMSAIIIKGGKKLPANVYLALELAAHGGGTIIFKGLYFGLVGNLAGVLPLRDFIQTVGAVGGAASSLIRVPMEGYGSFLLRDLPFDAIQFCIYEKMLMGYKLAAKRDLKDPEIAIVGAFAGNEAFSLARKGKEKEEKMAGIPQKRKGQEEKAKAYRKSKKKIGVICSRKVTLKKRLTKMISQGAPLTSHSRAWEELDVKIMNRGKVQREASLADQIRAAITERTESNTKDALAAPSTLNLFAGS
ncbi:unnamed protein product [Dovyalis caffra]|uniref:choline-phosphate cytidylyltransferase n=1 Tax=Dovyalis caffra TaxID=77055 RepID=A0AAV1R7P0_9ROSI|nr:unnamed protein product [Dovyalis caffra]